MCETYFIITGSSEKRYPPQCSTCCKGYSSHPTKYNGMSRLLNFLPNKCMMFSCWNCSERAYYRTHEFNNGICTFCEINFDQLCKHTNTKKFIIKPHQESTSQESTSQESKCIEVWCSDCKSVVPELGTHNFTNIEPSYPGEHVDDRYLVCNICRRILKQKL